MEHDGALAPDILRLEIQHLDEELGEFVDARRQFLGGCLASRVFGKQRRIVVLHHAGAGTRRDDNRPVVGEQRQLVRRHLARFVREAAGVGRLAAAGLFFRKVHADALPFEQRDGIHAGAGEKLVNDAGGKEIDVGWTRRLCGHFVSDVNYFTVKW